MVDYLIVGQGLAGSVFYHTAKANNKTAIVIDRGHEHSASAVAFGILNPLLIKRFVLAWQSDVFYHDAVSFFYKVQSEYGSTFVYPKTVYRPLFTQSDYNLFAECTENRFIKFNLTPQILPPQPSTYSHPHAGFAMINGVYYIDILSFIQAVRENLMSSARIFSETFEANQYTEDTQGVSYKGIRAKYLVLCTGYQSKSDKLPFISSRVHPLWGQKFVIQNYGILPNTLLKTKFFHMLNNDQHTISVGSTYEHREGERAIDKGRDMIMEDIYHLNPRWNGKVLARKRAARAQSVDRRPVIGRHYQYSRGYVFNGLGSRGLLQSPTLAQRLIDYIEKNRAIDKVVSINRFDRG